MRLPVPRHLLSPRGAGLLLALLVCSGCVQVGDASQPIPTMLLPSELLPSDGDAARTLVVVLPGRSDDLNSLYRRAVREDIQRAWPHADVLLTGLTLAYYREGRMDQRLHEEVVLPARRRGDYEALWLVGISLGGMGALMYENHYAGEVDGLVLLGPYLGDREILEQIGATGIGNWSPGPAPEVVNEENFQHELWRRLVQLQWQPRRAARIHVVYGERDRFKGALPLMRQLLPDDNVRTIPGGHDWRAWHNGLREVLDDLAVAAPPGP